MSPQDFSKHTVIIKRTLKLHGCADDHLCPLFHMTTHLTFIRASNPHFKVIASFPAKIRAVANGSSTTTTMLHTTTILPFNFITATTASIRNRPADEDDVRRYKLYAAPRKLKHVRSTNASAFF